MVVDGRWPDGAAARHHHLPRQRAPTPGQRGPHQGRNPAGDCRATCSPRSPYIGSTYVNQFNKFGPTFQVYVQADAHTDCGRDDIASSTCAAEDGTDGAARHAGHHQAGGRAIADQPLQSLSGRHHHRRRAPGFSSGQAMDLMEQIAAADAAAGTGYEWTAMSYQEKAVGKQIYLRLRPRAPARLSLPRRPVRKLDRPARRDPGGAAGAARPRR